MTCSRPRFAWIKVLLDLPTLTSEIRYNVHSQRILAGKYDNLHLVPWLTLHALGRELLARYCVSSQKPAESTM